MGLAGGKAWSILASPPGDRRAIDSKVSAGAPRSLERPSPAAFIVIGVPSPVIGAGLAVLLLCLVGAGILLVLRRPFIGLGVLVAGMAFHNFALMVLLALHTPPLLIRIVQSWKEIVLGVLILLAARQVLRAREQGWVRRLIPTDWIAIAFSGVVVVYLLLPSEFFAGNASFLQKLVAFRIAMLIPLVYFLGRVFSNPSEPDLRLTSWLIVGAGGVVGAFGLYELWFVPTEKWLDWGINLYSSWLGFTYHGPAGLPENFFQTLPDGLLLRRMVSTYISPLGIAYTGLLCWPIAVILVDRPLLRRRTAILTGIAVALLLLGILFSVTRLALLMLAAEAVVLAFLLRTRITAGLGVLVVISVVSLLFLYPLHGPVVDPSLLPGVSKQHTVLYVGDPSFQEHWRALFGDLRVIWQYPFGLGLGASVNRFVQAGSGGPAGTGESALLGIFGDAGILAGALYVGLYGLSLYSGLRAVGSAGRRSLALALPLVASVGGLMLIPITFTSDVWADFSVTFLFWWAAGYAASIATRRSAMAPGEAPHAVDRQSARLIDKLGTLASPWSRVLMQSRPRSS